MEGEGGGLSVWFCRGFGAKLGEIEGRGRGRGREWVRGREGVGLAGGLVVGAWGVLAEVDVDARV